MATVLLGPAPARRAVLARRIRLLVAATITYNVIEAVVALWAGAAASSSALLGFGLDSVIEVSSAAAVAWQFAGSDPQARERATLRVIACSFFALAAIVTIDSVRALLVGGEAQHSTPGLVIAGLSLLIMPVLSLTQRRAGRQLGSASAVADSKQTLLCTYLSAVLLVGLALNSLFGWSWADPIAGLVIAGIAVREGLDAWRGDLCCAPGSAAANSSEPDCGCAPGPTASDASEPDCRCAPGRTAPDAAEPGCGSARGPAAADSAEPSCRGCAGG